MFTENSNAEIGLKKNDIKYGYLIDGKYSKQVERS